MDPNPPSNSSIITEISTFWGIPEHQQGIRDDRRRGAPPLGFSQGREAFDSSALLRIDPELCRGVDSAQDREPVERPVERQMMP
jgi:hypothetical protein